MATRAEIQAIGGIVQNARGTVYQEARPAAEWHEDIGDVLWWRFPVEEPPYVGSPNDLGFTVEVEIRTHAGTTMHRSNVGGWPGYHTHWTPIPMALLPRSRD